MSQLKYVLLVPIVTSVLALSANAIQTFGGPGFSKGDLAVLSPTWKVMILPNAVEQDGKVFAFSAFTSSSTPAPFEFQIYRPQSSSSFQLVYNLSVTPSVLGQQEIFYVDSYLGTQSCFQVLKGDLLGIYFHTFPQGLSIYFDNTGQRITLISSEIDSDGLVEGNTLPYYVDALGYYDNAAGLACPNALGLISYLNLTLNQPTTTPYGPPVGAPGQRGQAGATGYTGRTGPQGGTGLLGIVGSLGRAGIIGEDGTMGDTGLANLVKGDNGTMGLNGSTGFMGPIGSVGALGTMGINGSIGYEGSNYTVIVFGPLQNLLHGDFFVAFTSVRGLFVWLAIDSFAFLVAVIALVFVCRLHAELKRTLEKSDESVR